MSNKINLVCFLLLILFLNGTGCWRLKDPGVLPIHYDLVLLPILTGRNPRLCGHVYIDVEAQATTNLIRFHGLDLEILDATIEPLDNQSGGITSRLDRLEELCLDRIVTTTITDEARSYRAENNGFRILREDHIKQEWSAISVHSMMQGKRYRLGFLYTAKMNEDLPRGFFRVKYTNDGSCCEKWIGATQMESTHARRVLPCFDEPGYKATFTVTVGHETEMKPVSNMPDMLSRPMSNTEGWSWTLFDRSPLMPTYLLSVMITDFEYKQIIYYAWDRPVLLRFWARQDRLPLLNRTIHVTPKLLRSLETYVQESYSLPKLDLMSIPSNLPFAAMENWGLILFSETLLLHDEVKDSAKDGFQDDQVMAHELAHQFFGNLLTSVWWSEIWLNEGMSNLFEHELISQALPDDEFYNELAFGQSVQSVMRMDEGRYLRSVSQDLEDGQDVDSIFDPISYNKGSAILRMARNFLGRDVFRNGLISYIDKHRYQNVHSDQLWDALDDELHRSFQEDRFGNGRHRPVNVRRIMDSWTKQSSYPIVRCEWVLLTEADGVGLSPGRMKIRLSQTPYPTQDGKSNASALWWIPIPLTDASRADFSPSGTLPRLWLTPDRPSLEVAIPPPKEGSEQKIGWILLNGQMSGYYRVQYDELNYWLLSEQLLRNHSVIPDVTRNQLISDAFTLAEDDLIGYDVGPLQLIKYLKEVDDEFVRPTAVLHLTHMMELCADSSQFEIYKEYLRQFIQSMSEEELNSLGRAENGNRPSNHYPTISRILSKDRCDLADDHCVQKARQLYNSLINDSLTLEEKKMVADEMETVWCTSIRHGGQSEWDFAWKKSLQPDWSLQRSKILSALSCSTDSKKLKRLLSRVFHHSVDQSADETRALLQGMAENPEGRSLALRFITTNFKSLNNLFGRSRDSVKLLSAASKYSKTADDYKEMAIFLGTQKAVISKTESAAILGNIRNNIRWMETRSEKITSIIADFVTRRR